MDIFLLFINSEDGAAAVEYVLIVACIGIFIAAAVFGIGIDIGKNFDALEETISTPIP